MTDNKDTDPRQKRPVISGFIWLGIGLFLLGQTTETLPPFEDTWPIFIIIVGLALIVGSVTKSRQRTN